MTKAELFLEIGTEELPAGYIEGALEQFCASVQEALREARVSFGALRSFATPRRMGLSLAEVALSGTDEIEEILGPPVKAAFAEDGTPKIPALKFAEKTGLALEALERKDTPKGVYLVGKVPRQGIATMTILQDALPAILGRLSFPKSMRWGRVSQRFARPLQWICAMLGGERIPFAYGGIASDTKSRGHRFLAPEAFAIRDAAHHAEELEKRFVVLSAEKRREIILEEGRKLAASCGGRLVEEAGLIDLNAFLVEYPKPLLASFEPAYLALPQEVLQTSMRVHLKCFVIVDEAGKMLPYFLPISALPSKDEAVVKYGYQRVLRARLSDAKFFYDEDQKKTLESRLPRLDAVIFQNKLGSYGEKVKRIGQISEALLGMLALQGEEAIWVRRAALLCKADLLTGMVYEFPELQGIMGRYYAQHDGEAAAVADALRDHYLPAGQDDAIPAGAVSQVVALADRLDTLVGGFAVELKPTGSADPYGLRRQAIGILRILREAGLGCTLGAMIDASLAALGGLVSDPAATRTEVLGFLTGRLQAILLREGWQRDLVDAICVEDLVARHSLPALASLLVDLKEAVATGILAKLAYSFKRVNNILRAAGKKDAWMADYPGLGSFYREEIAGISSEGMQEEAEKTLCDAYLGVKAKLEDALQRAAFSEAFAALCTLQAPIDGMFEQVMVMAEDAALRERRLRMLRGIARLAFLDVAKIETDEQDAK